LEDRDKIIFINQGIVETISSESLVTSLEKEDLYIAASKIISSKESSRLLCDFLVIIDMSFK
jgi:hypothetical protein